MKLCFLIFFLLIFDLTFTKIFVFNSPKILSAPPRKLRQININLIKDKLDKIIQNENWVSIIESPTSIIIQARISSKLVNFIEVSVKDDPVSLPNLPKTYLTFSNLPKKIQDTTFARFKTHKIFSRQTLSDEPGVDESFIQKTVDKFKVAFEKILKHKNVSEMYENIKKMIQNEQIKDLVLVESANTPDNIIFDLILTSSKKLVSKVIIYWIDDTFIGLAFSQHDDVSYFNVPADNIKSSNLEIIKVLVDKTRILQNKLEISDVSTKIKTTVRDLCAGSLPGIEQLTDKPEMTYFKITRSGQTNQADKAHICAFVDSDIIVTKYSYGYMQYFHLLYDSRFLREEYLIVTTKDKFESSFNKAFQLIKADTEIAHKSVLGSAVEVELTFDLIKKVLSDGIGEEPVNDDFNATELQNCQQTGNICNGKFKFPTKNAFALVFTTAEGWVISVTKIAQDKTPFSIQLSTSVKSGVDQRPALVLHLRQFIAAH